MRFHAERTLSPELSAAIAAMAPENPFVSSRYQEARRALGWEPWVLSLRNDARMIAACPAFMRAGRLGRTVEIVSVPPIPGESTFWQGLVRWCRGQAVTDLEVNTYASASFRIPLLPGERQRRARIEYVLELQDPGLWQRLSSNHERNIKRGRMRGLTLWRSSNREACLTHARLVAASLERRRLRGEPVAQDDQQQARPYVALVESGAGELFQAVFKGKILSSVLVLLAERGAYYHSAGTDPEGLTCGASHFLVYEIANELRAASFHCFNLGGVSEPGSGLEQFKRGFGGRRVELEATVCDLRGPLQRALGAGARLLRKAALAR